MAFTQSYHRIAIFISGILAVLTDTIQSEAFYVFNPLTTILILSYPLIHKNNNLRRFSNLVSIGLLFCLFGDVFLLFESYFVFGLGAFLIGHLFFLFAFVSVHGGSWKPKIGIVLFAFASVIFVLIQENLKELYYPVMIYVLVIVLMSWQGWGLALNTEVKKQRQLGLGVTLFLFSDTLIALDKFYFSFSIAGILILISYWFAVFLIAQSASK